MAASPKERPVDRQAVPLSGADRRLCSPVSTVSPREHGVLGGDRTLTALRPIGPQPIAYTEFRHEDMKEAPERGRPRAGPPAIQVIPAGSRNPGGILTP
jgi:hypothetical protein